MRLIKRYKCEKCGEFIPFNLLSVADCFNCEFVKCVKTPVFTCPKRCLISEGNGTTD